jgi:hypothetical protein
MRPKGVLMMLVNSMSKLMHDDIITELYREPHKLDIEADSIAVATAPPSGFLMTASDALIGKSEVLRQLHGPMWEIGFSELTKFRELS